MRYLRKFDWREIFIGMVIGVVIGTLLAIKVVDDRREAIDKANQSSIKK